MNLFRYFFKGVLLKGRPKNSCAEDGRLPRISAGHSGPSGTWRRSPRISDEDVIASYLRIAFRLGRLVSFVGGILNYFFEIFLKELLNLIPISCGSSHFYV